MSFADGSSEVVGLCRGRDSSEARAPSKPGALSWSHCSSRSARELPARPTGRCEKTKRVSGMNLAGWRSRAWGKEMLLTVYGLFPRRDMSVGS